MIRNEDEKNALNEQLKFYKNNNVIIHIEKSNGLFYNGKILELSGDMIILDDRKLGAIPIHFVEICILEKYMELEK